MNYTLTTPHNIDALIQEIQTVLYNELIVLWQTDKLDAYGRVYKNEKSGVIIPEVFTNSDYKEVFYNNQSCFFFIDEDNHPLEDQDHEFTTNVKIVFMLNLSDLKTATERVDADVKKDVLKILVANDGHFDVKGYEKGIDNVLSGFDTTKLKGQDMQPLHVFAIETAYSYSVT